MPTYQRLPQQENENVDSRATMPAVERRKKAREERKQLMDTINNKIHATLWVAAGGAILYYTEIVRTVLEAKPENVAR